MFQSMPKDDYFSKNLIANPYNNEAMNCRIINMIQLTDKALTALMRADDNNDTMSMLRRPRVSPK